MGIPKIPYVELLLRAMHARGGEIKRRDIIVDLFSRNWSRARIDGLLADPHLAGLIEVSREPMRGARRKSTRYRLTAHGWAAANRIVNQPPPRWNREEIARQFNLLVAEGDSWATELTRQAARGRVAEAQEQRKREEAKAARQREIDALPRHPSAGRKRSAKELEQRAAWCARHGFGPLVQESEAQPVASASPAPVAPVAPPIPSAPPLTADQQAAKDFREALGLSGRYYGPSSAMPKDCEPIQPRLMDAKELAKQATLLQKICDAGYQVKGDRVLYDNRWITPSEWVDRMPNALD